MRIILTLFPCLMLIGLATCLPGEEPEGARKTTAEEVQEILDSVSNWGRWGEDDELGTLNLITPRRRRQAASLVRAGVSISMAHDVIKERMDGSSPFEHELMVNAVSGGVGGAGDRYSVQYHGFTQTHLDALFHIFYQGKTYNGYSADQILTSGSGQLSINRVRNGIFTRAVLMDIPALLGVQYLEGAQAIYPEHLEAWEKKAGVRVRSGDAVLVNTGRWTRREQEGPWDIMAGSAGLHVSCLKWLRERDVALVGSDLALDVMPSGSDGIQLPVHLGVIVQMGMPILDCCDFRAVAEESRRRKQWTFLLTLAPLAVEGGTGSPINPIATY
ncbi:MAG: cyclase family protein [Planctomycetota bacterium]|nr:cyclase family protein [Planctomycetota bacterium]